MPARVFVDSNVLVYARDASEAWKQARAMTWISELWKSRSGRLSVQVLQEYYVTVTQKLTPGMKRDSARQDVRDLFVWRPVSMRPEVLEAAWRIQDRYGLSWWDTLIVAAALVSDSQVLLTEDLQDGQSLGDITVMNPFLHVPEEVSAAR